MSSSVNQYPPCDSGGGLMGAFNVFACLIVEKPAYTQ